MISGLYSGLVRHERFAPKRHRLRYGVFMLALDIDELPALDQRLKCFSHNHPGLLAFYDRDHGDGSGTPLRPHIEAKLRAAGQTWRPARIVLLSMPRLFGFVFNPLSVYFCSDAEGVLRAIVYEVKNTFGERHDYVLPVTGQEGSRVAQACRKNFFVSPFLHMNLGYEFDIAPPGETVSVAMRVRDKDALKLTASFTGAREEMTDGALLRALARRPLMTFGAVAAIHWEAVKLLAKGVPFLGRRRAAEPPLQSVTAVTMVTFEPQNLDVEAS